MHKLRRAKSRAFFFFFLAKGKHVVPLNERVLKLIKYLCLVLQSSYKIRLSIKVLIKYSGNYYKALIGEKQIKQVVIN